MRRSFYSEDWSEKRAYFENETSVLGTESEGLADELKKRGGSSESTSSLVGETWGARLRQQCDRKATTRDTHLGGKEGGWEKAAQAGKTETRRLRGRRPRGRRLPSPSLRVGWIDAFGVGATISVALGGCWASYALPDTRLGSAVFA